jgi:hypothetical protein
MTSHGIRWDEVPPDTVLGAVVAPYRGLDTDETALGGHLFGTGTVQLFNPGFDDHLIGPGLVPWFGYGSCALLAWHLHLKSGWPLVTLVPGVSAPMVHTGVRTPAGLILDWRGAQSENEAVQEYRRWVHPPSMTEPDRPSWRWKQSDPDEWVQMWLTGKDRWNVPATSLIELGGWDITAEVGGRVQHISPYDQFEIALADYLADCLIQEVLQDMLADERAGGIEVHASLPAS